MTPEKPVKAKSEAVTAELSAIPVADRATLAKVAKRFEIPAPQRHRPEKLSDSLSYPPRAMRADRAAAYLSMSQSAFLRLVEERLMPKPVKIKGMVTWDRLQLDAAFEDLKDPDEVAENTMHKILGIKP